MAVAAAVLALIWFLIAFVGRSILQRWRTGDSGLRVRASPRAERVLFIAAVVAMLVALALAAADVLRPIAALAPPFGRAFGLGVAALGAIATFAAQMDLGASWRIGVDPEERTELMTGGLFAVVRNPIFSAMIVTTAGLVMASPTWLALVGGLLTVASIEFQVRRVEEPYLRRVHGAPYERYAARAGRFVPWLGRGLSTTPGERSPLRRVRVRPRRRLPRPSRSRHRRSPSNS